ncbi:MAG: hypothetical protein ACOCYT_01715, partial [Chloroflexota bacterium]
RMGCTRIKRSLASGLEALQRPDVLDECGLPVKAEAVIDGPHGGAAVFLRELNAPHFERQRDPPPAVRCQRAGQVDDEQGAALVKE